MKKYPNILFITWHDAGKWFGCCGAQHVSTPNVDRLASEGVLFQNHFSTCAQCSPSRASCMTGTYPQTNDVLYLTHENCEHNALAPDIKHLTHVLKDSGYDTSSWGIAHEANHEDYQTRLNFDEVHCYPPPHAHTIADRFYRWIRKRNSNAPFYAQISLWEAHTPFQKNGGEKDFTDDLCFPPDFTDTPESREWVRGMQGALRFGDSAIGSILNALKENGLEQDTIVIMTSDHGADMPRAKMHLFDRGIEVPLIIRWPEHITGGSTLDIMSSHIDVLPTLLDLVDLPVPMQVQGKSLAAHIQGNEYGEVHEEIYAHIIGTQRCIRTPKFKLIRTFDSEKTYYDSLPIDSSEIEFTPNFPYRSGRKPHYPFALLYDLDLDPDETTNLAEDVAYQDVLIDLNNKLMHFLQTEEDPVINRKINSDPFYDKNLNTYYQNSLKDFFAMTQEKNGEILPCEQEA